RLRNLDSLSMELQEFDGKRWQVRQDFQDELERVTQQLRQKLDNDLIDIGRERGVVQLAWNKAMAELDRVRTKMDHAKKESMFKEFRDYFVNEEKNRSGGIFFEGAQNRSLLIEAHGIVRIYGVISWMENDWCPRML